MCSYFYKNCIHLGTSTSLSDIFNASAQEGTLYINFPILILLTLTLRLIMVYFLFCFIECLQEDIQKCIIMFPIVTYLT